MKGKNIFPYQIICDIVIFIFISITIEESNACTLYTCINLIFSLLTCF